MNLNFISNKGVLQIVKFLISGGISAILEIGLLITFVDGLKLDYLKANILVFLIGGPINFYLSKYWVFEKGALRGYVQIIGFALLALLNLILNQFLLWIFVEFIHTDYRISKVLAIGICVLFNFLVKKCLIFERKKNSMAPTSLEFVYNSDHYNQRK